jgi:hypothetical protein
MIRLELPPVPGFFDRMVDLRATLPVWTGQDHQAVPVYRTTLDDLLRRRIWGQAHLVLRTGPQKRTVPRRGAVPGCLRTSWPYVLSTKYGWPLCTPPWGANLTNFCKKRLDTSVKWFMVSAQIPARVGWFHFCRAGQVVCSMFAVFFGGLGVHVKCQRTVSVVGINAMVGGLPAKGEPERTAR